MFTKTTVTINGKKYIKRNKSAHMDSKVNSIHMKGYTFVDYEHCGPSEYPIYIWMTCKDEFYHSCVFILRH